MIRKLEKIGIHYTSLTINVYALLANSYAYSESIHKAESGLYYKMITFISK